LGEGEQRKKPKKTWRKLLPKALGGKGGHPPGEKVVKPGALKDCEN